MTLEEAAACVEADPYVEHYAWLICPATVYARIRTLYVMVYRLSDRRVWSAALGATACVDKVLDGMHTSFEVDFAEDYLAPDDLLYDNHWVVGAEQELEAELTDSLSLL